MTENHIQIELNPQKIWIQSVFYTIHFYCEGSLNMFHSGHFSIYKVYPNHILQIYSSESIIVFTFFSFQEDWKCQNAWKFTWCYTYQFCSELHLGSLVIWSAIIQESERINQHVLYQDLHALFFKHKWKNHCLMWLA